MKSLVKVSYTNFSRIDDGTFSLSAIDAEATTNGYILYLVDSSAKYYSATLDKAGKVVNYKQLTNQELFQAEETYQVDLNGNGGYGAKPVLVATGAVNVYLSGDNTYQFGQTIDNLKNITMRGEALTGVNSPFTYGSEILKIFKTTAGYRGYLAFTSGEIFRADFDTNGGYLSGKVLTEAELTADKQSLITDINGAGDAINPTNLLNNLQDSFIKNQLVTVSKSKIGVSLDYARRLSENAILWNLTTIYS